MSWARPRGSLCLPSEIRTSSQFIFDKINASKLNGLGTWLAIYPNLLCFLLPVSELHEFDSLNTG